MRELIRTGIALLLASSLAACGGSGGGGSTVGAPADPPASSGKLDPGYANGIKLIYVGPQQPLQMAVDSSGKASVGGSFLAQFDAFGSRIAPAPPANINAETSPVVDEFANVFTVGSVSSGGYEIIKRDREGRLAADFGNAGRVAIDAAGLGGITQMLRDATGNFYLVGRVQLANISGPSTIVAGKVDPTGKRVASYGAVNGIATLVSVYKDPEPKVALDSAGNLFFAVADAGTSGTSVRKLDSDGRYADDFGVQGVARAPCAGAVQHPFVATDSSGNVYLGATCVYAVAVWKFDALGRPAVTFGAAGAVLGFYSPPVTPDSNFPATAAAYALLPNADGSIYVAASVLNTAACAGGVAVVKLRANGMPEPSFGSDGTAMLDLRPGQPVAFAADGAGRLYVLGETPPVGPACPLPRDVPYSFSLFRLR